MKQPYDWINAITRKRPETILLLHALLLEGIRKGKVTAENAHHIPVSHPNCRGAAMKLLARCGFRRGNPIKGSTDQSHGHWLMVWELEDYSKAKGVQDKLFGVMASDQYNYHTVDSRGQLSLI